MFFAQKRPANRRGVVSVSVRRELPSGSAPFRNMRYFIDGSVRMKRVDSVSLSARRVPL